LFAPGWLKKKLTEWLKALTVEIQKPEIEMPEEIQTVLDEAEDEADELYEEIRERLEAIGDRVQKALDGWEPEIPKVDVPELDLGEVNEDWILDPSRLYFEQLNAFKRHRAAHRDRTPTELQKRVCAACGGPMPEELSPQARYCLDRECMQARRRAWAATRRSRK
jgi:RNA polymerase-binding transcription factor DksA